ncbi:MAG: putative sugar nucleotidyl transferase [Bacteroidales bacterium]
MGVINYILFDSKVRETLKPLTYTRPVCDIRVGILTIQEKWNKWLETETSCLTEDYLQEKYPFILQEDMIFIDGSICPTKELIDAINTLKVGEVLIEKHTLQIIAKRETADTYNKNIDRIEKKFEGEINNITSLVSIFKLNGKEIEKDYILLTNGRETCELSLTNRCIGENIFVESGAKVEFSILNATEGPIYIGKNCQIMENAVIRGPFAMNNNSVIKIGAKIYGPVTLGPYCKVGGEVSDVVFFGYSNKAHDGYFGDSVIGQWCNIGADSNTSNLKNTYDEVKLWSEEHSTFKPTGEIFVGTIMADHTKCGINTMFNTGTVIGVSCNVFGPGFQRNYIPSFVWGGTKGVRHDYDVEKAIQVAQAMEKRRNIEMSEVDKKILRHIYKITRIHLKEE